MTYDDLALAFNKKMQLSLVATGSDIEKVASAYEEELEKIANPFLNLIRGAGGAATRAGQAWGRAVPEGLLAVPRRTLVDPVVGAWQGAGGALQKARTAWTAGREAAKRPTITMPSTPTPSAATSAGTGAAPARVRMADAGTGTVPGATRGPAAGAAPPPAATLRKADAAVPVAGSPAAGAPAATEVATTQAATAPGQMVDDAVAALQKRYQGAQSWLGERYGLNLGAGANPEAGLFGAQGMGQWFSSLPLARQAELLSPLGVGALGVGGAGIGAAGLGAGLIGGGLGGALIGRATA